MAKIKKEYKTAVEDSPEKERISEYKREWTAWYNPLQDWHINRFDKNYRQYTGNIAIKGTQSNISDPVAPELIERVNQKLFERDPNFYVMARGKDIPEEITETMMGIASYLWSNPAMVQNTGTAKSKIKTIGREFLITGNVAVESYYNAEADTPDFRLIPIEDVIFDPTKNLKTSNAYYVRQFLSLEDLEDMAEVTKDGKVISGIFKKDAIERLKAKVKNQTGVSSDRTSNWVNRSGSNNFERNVAPIELISRWEGTKLCQIADWEEIIREVEDPMQIGDDPLDFAMDIEVPKQPYALSMLDFIAGLAVAKDLMINQVIDYSAKALNPPLFVDPSLPTQYRSTLRNAFKTGGLVFASPQSAQHLPMPPLPSNGFDLMTYIQQRTESVTGIGAYTGGIPNQSSDKTEGTKGGIEALISQAISPIRDRQVNIEESIIEPVINKWLKMTAALMGTNEEKFVFLTGENPRWIKATKGLISGKVKLNDLLVAGLIDQTELQEIAQSMESRGKNPEKEIVFDVDWIIRVETGSMAEADTQKEREGMLEWINFNMQFGIPMDLPSVSKRLGMIAGIKEPERYLLTAQEQQGPPSQDQQAPGQQGQQQGPGGPEAAASAQASQAQAQNAQAQAQLHQQRAQNETQVATTTSQKNQAEAQHVQVKAQTLAQESQAKLANLNASTLLLHLKAQEAQRRLSEPMGEPA